MTRPGRYEPLRFPRTLHAALSAEAAAAEAARALTPLQLDHIVEAGWFRMFVPQDRGGLQLPLPEALRIEEALAALDGSLGWTVTLCSGAGLFAGFVDSALLDTMFRAPRLCVGGSGAPTGTATRIPGGYRVSGSWRYATGAPHLTAFSANCRILNDGQPVYEADGSESIRSFLFLPDEVALYDDWQVMGLRATASQQFRIRDLNVPEERSFQIRPEAARAPDPVYQYPFLQFAELTLAANFGGMALGFLERFEDGMRMQSGAETRRTIRLAALDECRRGLLATLNRFHDAARRSWDELQQLGRLEPERLSALSRISRELAAAARRNVGELMPLAGLAAADPATELNRCWRDLFTATQHSLLNYPA